MAEAYAAPRNGTERILTGIYGELFGLDAVGIHDNFSSLGGHSLLAIQLMYRVNEAFQAEIPVTVYLGSPTVAQLAEQVEAFVSTGRLNRQHATPEKPYLVPLGTRVDADSIVCIHPMGGQVHWYRHLARVLNPSHNVLGIQSRALGNAAIEHQSMLDLADEYADLIRIQVPRGPLRLVGFSTGGIFALAIVEALESGGSEVDLVGLLDSYTLPDDEMPVDSDSILSLLHNLRGSFTQNPGLDVLWESIAKRPETRFREDLRQQSEALRQHLLPLSSEQRMEKICDWLATMNPVFGSFKELIRQQLDLLDRHHRLVKSFMPSSIRARLYVCWASETIEGADSSTPVDWAAYTSGESYTHVVTAEHYALIQSPAVESVSAHLAAFMGRSEQSSNKDQIAAAGALNLERP